MTATPLDITVSGMTCEGCAGNVKAALEGTAGVAEASVDHVTGIATVTPDGTVAADDLEFALDEAVEAAGYRVVPS